MDILCHSTLSQDVHKAKKEDIYMAVSLTGKYATQSSTYQSAEHGVDGIYGGSGSMYSSTDAEIQPWWMVNLEKTCFVYEVKLFNSPECKCTNVVISVE